MSNLSEDLAGLYDLQGNVPNHLIMIVVIVGTWASSIGALCPKI